MASTVAAAGWRWADGETWSYTNWFSGNPAQPDNSGSQQNYVRCGADFAWDDFQNDPSNPSIQYISGYFVEYSVPEPASIAVSTSLCGFVLLRRRRATAA